MLEANRGGWIAVPCEGIPIAVVVPSGKLSVIGGT
jgi:hypothetical protein